MNKLIPTVVFAVAAALAVPSMAASHAAGAPMKAASAPKKENKAAAKKETKKSTKKEEKN
jgi:hypothetical protein